MGDEHSKTGDPAVGSTRLLAVLGPTSPSRDVTLWKTEHIIRRDGMQVTGFVLTSADGNIGIVDKGAVRWLTKDELWWLMHESKSPLQTANVRGQAGRGKRVQHATERRTRPCLHRAC